MNADCWPSSMTKITLTIMLLASGKKEEFKSPLCKPEASSWLPCQVWSQMWSLWNVELLEESPDDELSGPPLGVKASHLVVNMNMRLPCGLQQYCFHSHSSSFQSWGRTSYFSFQFQLQTMLMKDSCSWGHHGPQTSPVHMLYKFKLDLIEIDLKPRTGW